MDRLLCRHEYARLGRRQRGLLRTYIEGMTRFGRAQSTRRIGGYVRLSDRSAQAPAPELPTALCSLRFAHCASLSTYTPTSTCNRFCEQGGFARTGALEAIFCLQTNYAPGEGERKPVLQKVSW